MLRTNDFMTSLADIKIIKNSLVQSLFKLPRLIFLNLPLMILFVLFEGWYSYTLIFKHENELLSSVSDLNFAVLQFAFLIFLVPFQLHHQSSMSYKKFTAFVKKHTWSVVIESCKAIMYLIGYLILTGASAYLAYFIYESLENLLILAIPLAILFILLSLGSSLCFLIRSIQYNFIPFVVFFDSEYQSTRKKAIQKSIKISKGVALPVTLVFVLFMILSQILQLTSLPNFITPEPTPLSVMSFIANSIIGLIFVIYFCSFFYYIYQAKKSR